MKMHKILIPFLLAVFLISANSYSQTQSKVAEDMAVKLQQKVLLSKDQTIKVKEILINYLGNMNQSSLETAKKSVVSLLDKRQKAKYEIIEKDWWNRIQSEAGSKG